MNTKINIIKMNGQNVEADVICYFELTNSGRRFIYYTLNETSGNGADSTVKVYTAKISQGNPSLDSPITDIEWNKLKEIMGLVLKNSKIEDIKYLKLDGLANPTVISENAIAMPISYDYINKHRGVYAESIANDESGDAKTIEPVTPPVNNEPAVEASPVGTTNADTIINEPIKDNVVQTPTVDTPNAFAPSTNSFDSNPANPALNTVPEANTNPNSNTANQTVALQPINIEEIKTKYDELIKGINDLKAKEIEAAERYNATIKLNEMHTEQHMNYVAGTKEEPLNPSPTPAVESVTPTQVNTTPIFPSNATTNNETNIETNWFDMPAN